MTRFITWKSAAFAIMLLLTGSITALAAIPNPYRGFAAPWFDMTEIAPHVYIDNASKKEQALSLLRASLETVGSFYGKMEANPRIILCTSDKCHQTFGGGARGTSYGGSLLRVGPLGFNKTILTHELFHSELHHRLGLIGMATNRIPVWFNEGIATYYSQDDRVSFNHDQKTKQWIRGAKSHFGDWGNYATREKWQLAYGAAAANIKDLENTIGRIGLKRIIIQVTERKKGFAEILQNAEAEKQFK